MNKVITLILFILLVNITLHAQTQYHCDFEDITELRQWTLNSGKEGPNMANKWFVGTAVNNGGNSSLYVSSDPDGLTTNYTNKGLTVTAYRTITLPNGRYELSFDWQAVGLPSDGLYVCWVPDSEIVPSTPNTSMPTYINLYAVDFGGRVGTKLNSSSWTTASAIIESDGTPHKLVFAWRNGVVSTAPPAACVDNVYVFPEGQCKKPSKVKVDFDQTTGKVMIQWQGAADSYDLRCKLPGSDKWQEMTGIKQNHVLFDNNKEGAVEVYVRSNCGDAFTAWTSYNSFIWFTGLRCLDLFDLNDKNCFVGTHFYPKQGSKHIDYGYSVRESRHTIHYDQYETDPRTDGMVRTVPEGEIASVRLGNWNIGNEAEAIEYKYHVEADKNAILMLKYAAVLQDPGHEAANQPRFSIRVLGEDGNSIDGVCIDEDFVAGNTTTSGWVQSKSKGELINGVEGSDVAPLYKDWTTIGINLKDYDNRDLTIELTTYDCVQTGHYGYAYFTINCSDAKVRGLSCGTMAENIFEAPDGFKYLWYLADDETKKEVSTQQRLIITDPKDTRTYACDVISLTDAQCYYTIFAIAEPRFPYPDARYTVSDIGCENTVAFVDSSCVIRVNPETTDTVYEKDIRPDSVLWCFNLDDPSSPWVNEENPVKLFPRTGGTFRVGVKAFLAECEEMQVITLDLPHLDYKRDTTYKNICSDEGGVEFAGGMYYETGIYTDTVPSPDNRCDSIYYLNLVVGQPSDSTVADTVCSADIPYVFNGNEYSATGTYTVTIDNAAGCDSVITLDLIVNESLVIDVPDEVGVCADDTALIIPFTLSSGLVTACDITYSDSEMNTTMGAVGVKPDMENSIVSLPMTKDIRPGKYRAELLFKNMECGDSRQPVVVSVMYPDSIVAQRWNDVLAIHNAGYNGGYDFVACQWYADGAAIEGATGMSYYAPQGLNTEASYSALLTRVSDGVSAFTCSVVPVRFDEQSIENEPVITINGNGVEAQVAESAMMTLYSLSGQVITSRYMSEGESILLSGIDKGIYIMYLVDSTGYTHVTKVVVR